MNYITLFITLIISNVILIYLIISLIICSMVGYNYNITILFYITLRISETTISLDIPRISIRYSNRVLHVNTASLNNRINI